LNSGKRGDAIMLKALIEVYPDSDLIPKVVKGLLGARKEGKWGSTQENAFVLMALESYFRVYESQTPDFISQMWLGDLYVGSHKFAGHSVDYHLSKLPMKYMVNNKKDKSNNLIMTKKGTGRLYYRMAMKYAPKELVVDPIERGFSVERKYAGADRKEDVILQGTTYVIKAGARVKVTVKFRVTSARNHVAVVDYLPAGMEILNSAVKGEDAVAEKEKISKFWWLWGNRRWFDHQNLRDERAEAFCSYLSAGEYEYCYYTRATTLGKFIAPPAKAEEMYSPEVFGASNSVKVHVV